AITLVKPSRESVLRLLAAVSIICLFCASSRSLSNCSISIPATLFRSARLALPITKRAKRSRTLLNFNLLASKKIGVRQLQAAVNVTKQNFDFYFVAELFRICFYC